MKSFKFTLQAVRAVRERAEQSALREYVATLRVLEEAKNRSEAVEEEIAQAWKTLQGDSPSMEMARLQDSCEVLQERRRESASDLEAARQKAKRAFTRYLAAHQACVTVEQCCRNQKRRPEHGRVRRKEKAIDRLAQRSLSLASLICRSRGTLWN